MVVFLVAGEVLPSTNPVLAIGLSLPYSLVLGYVGLRVLMTNDVAWATSGLPIDVENTADDDPAFAGTLSSMSNTLQLPRPASQPGSHIDGAPPTGAPPA
jgi:hypothetical protein